MRSGHFRCRTTAGPRGAIPAGRPAVHRTSLRMLTKSANIVADLVEVAIQLVTLNEMIGYMDHDHSLVFTAYRLEVYQLPAAIIEDDVAESSSTACSKDKRKNCAYRAWRTTSLSDECIDMKRRHRAQLRLCRESSPGNTET